MTSEIVPSLSLDAFVMRRDAIVLKIREAHAAVVEAEEASRDMFGEEGRNGHRSVYSSLRVHTARQELDFATGDGLEARIKEVDSRAWAYLFDKSGLRTFMDSKAREKWDKAIYENDVPTITVESIEATFEAMYQARGEMFDRGLLEIWKALSWDYKTHNGKMFGKRVILRHITGYTGACYDGCNRLDDLARVLSVLDGKPEPDHRQGCYSKICHAARGEKLAVSEYFTVKLFKNGNGHLEFLRPDLVDKMNQIVARHYPGALAPSREAEKEAAA